MSREGRREYENDVFYEVWRSGGNPDEIDYDRVDDHFYNHDYPEAAADDELRKQTNRREQAEEEYQGEGEP